MSDGLKIGRLRPYDRRRNVFRYASVDATPEFAVSHAVEKIKQEPNSEPHSKPFPCSGRQSFHCVETSQGAKDCHQWQRTDSKRPWSSRIDIAQHQNADANNRKGRKRSNIG